MATRMGGKNQQYKKEQHHKKSFLDIWQHEDPDQALSMPWWTWGLAVHIRPDDTHYENMPIQIY